MFWRLNFGLTIDDLRKPLSLFGVRIQFFCLSEDIVQYMLWFCFEYCHIACLCEIMKWDLLIMLVLAMLCWANDEKERLLIVASKDAHRSLLMTLCKVSWSHRSRDVRKYHSHLLCKNLMMSMFLLLGLWACLCQDVNCFFC